MSNSRAVQFSADYFDFRRVWHAFSIGRNWHAIFSGFYWGVSIALAWGLHSREYFFPLGLTRVVVPCILDTVQDHPLFMEFISMILAMFKQENKSGNIPVVVQMDWDDFRKLMWLYFGQPIVGANELIDPLYEAVKTCIEDGRASIEMPDVSIPE